MDILIASILGTLFGLAVAYGNLGQKVADTLFVSARKACHMEENVNTPDSGKQSAKAPSRVS